MSTGNLKSRRIRFQLRTLLLLVAIVGIAAGWLVDRNRLTERLRLSEIEHQIRQDQLESLQQQLSVRCGVPDFHPVAARLSGPAVAAHGSGTLGIGRFLWEPSS